MNSKELHASDFCPNYVREFGLRKGLEEVEVEGKGGEHKGPPEDVNVLFQGRAREKDGCTWSKAGRGRVREDRWLYLVQGRARDSEGDRWLYLVQGRARESEGR